MRISKYLLLCGVSSRRGAESLIDEGRVTVNDSTVEKQGTIIDENKDTVKVDGTEVSIVEEKLYILFNKPANVLTTLFDPFKRRTVTHYLKGVPQRVYPVGRLDYDTEGVLLLSNDGDLAYRLAHPRYQVPRVYEANVLGYFNLEAAVKLQKGVKLDDGSISHSEVSILGYVKNTTRIRLILTQGRKREVKQICKKVGYPVIRLRRVEFAGITAKGLAGGKWRHLTQSELKKLRSKVGLNLQSRSSP